MQQFLKHFESLNLSEKRQKLLINEVEYTKSRFKKEFMTLAKTSNEAERVQLATQTVLNEYFTDDIYNSLLDKCKKATLPDTPSFRTHLDDLEIVYDLVTGEPYTIDMKRKRLSDFNPKAILAAMPSKTLKRIRDEVGFGVAKLYFDPYTTEKIHITETENGTPLYHINKYIEPKWITVDRSSEDIPMPQVMADFFNHLLKGNKEQISYLLDWLYLACFKRAETYLVLNGAKGAGKNTLFEVAQGIIGSKYCAIAPKSLGTSTFNAVLQDRRLILFDEFKFTFDVHQTAKRMINEEQAIEKKGVDVGEPIKTFNSFMIFHNSEADMYLERDDRRFSVLDIADTKLNEAFSEDWVSNLVKAFRDPDSNLLSDFAWYLKKRGDRRSSEHKINPMTPFKGEKFYEIVDYHLPVWIRAIINMLESGDLDGAVDYVISFAEIDKVIKERLSLGKTNYTRRIETVSRYLESYRYEGKYCVGKVFKDIGNKNMLTIRLHDDILVRFGYKEVEI